jgi:FSR family fosmidomycin resistance protein-like MFS transporter
MLAIGGAMVMASNSLLVAMAQELVPKSSGLASSLPLGFSWGIAGLTLAPIGYLAERVGVESALTLLAALPIATAFLALFLPSGRGLQARGEEGPSPEEAGA